MTDVKNIPTGELEYPTSGKKGLGTQHSAEIGRQGLECIPYLNSMRIISNLYLGFKKMNLVDSFQREEM